MLRFKEDFNNLDTDTKDYGAKLIKKRKKIPNKIEGGIIMRSATVSGLTDNGSLLLRDQNALEVVPTCQYSRFGTDHNKK